MPRYGRVCLGGTFSPIHAGHLSLLERAFSEGYKVSIGLTSDRMAAEGRARKVATFKERYRSLGNVCSEISRTYRNTFEIREIDDRTGFALEPDIDAIVVSEETEKGALEINDQRRERHLRPLMVIVVPIVRDERGEKMSSTSVQRRTVSGGDN